MIESLKDRLRDWEVFNLIRELYRFFAKKVGIKILSLFMLGKRMNKESEKLTVGIMDAGGFGDTLMELPLIEKIIETVGAEKCTIVFCNKYSSFYSEFKQITKALQYKNDIVSLAELYSACDLVLVAGEASHILSVRKINKVRVKHYSNKLFVYCEETTSFIRKYFSDGLHNYRIDQYGVMMGKHRLEFLDMQGVLGVTKTSAVRMPDLFQFRGILKKFGLEGKQYLVVNRDVGNGNENQPKLWAKENYIELFKLIKKKYPGLLIVLVGGKADKNLASYVDVDTSGQTSLQELAVLLKFSQALIACEGGPVHLQHFLGGKSIVIFGPTDPAMFGYPDNCNLSIVNCSRYCYWLVDNWSDQCVKGGNPPECLSKISPDIVMKCIEGIVKT